MMKVHSLNRMQESQTRNSVILLSIILLLNEIKQSDESETETVKLKVTKLRVSVTVSCCQTARVDEVLSIDTNYYTITS